MKRAKDIEDLVARVRYRGSAAARERIHSGIREAWQYRTAAEAGTTERSYWGGTTMSRWSKAAFIALALVIGGVWLGLLNKSTGPAYALEQTADAVRDMRFFHFQYLTGSDGPDREAWIEYDPNGLIRNVRVNFYGIKATMVWSPRDTQYWQWESEEFLIFDDEEYTDKILFFVQRYDPRQAIGYLQQRAEQGGIQVDIGPSDRSTDPITVTVTYDPNAFVIGAPKPRMRELFHIDPSTKLVTQVEVHAFQEGRYVDKGLWDYVDYNRPFEPGIFDLRSEVPPDVNCSDTTGILMGIEQGRLSDEEIAVKVVREFLDAWVSKDYDRAIQIHGYAAARQVKHIRDKLLQRKNVMRVVSVGPPVVPERPLRGLLTPCTIEYEEDGQVKTGSLEFRVSEGSRGRWRIRGPQPVK